MQQFNHEASADAGAWHNASKDILPYLDEGVAAFDAQYVVTSCNPAFIRLTSLSETQILNQTLYALFPVIGTGPFAHTAPFQREIRVSGQPFLLILFPATEAGGMALLKPLAKQIPEQNTVAAEPELIHRKAAQAVVNFPATGVVALDTRLNYVVWNSFMEELIGLKSTEVIGRHILEVFPGSETSEGYQAFVAALKGETVQLRNRKYSKGEVYYNADVFPLYSDRGDICGVISIIEDNTSQKQSEEKANRYEYELKEAYRLGNIGSWVLDLETREIGWSDELARIVGLPPEDLASFERYQQYIPEEDVIRIEEAIRKTAEHGSPFSIEHRLTHPDGTTQWLLARGKLIRDKTGQPVRLHGIALDITSLKKAQEQISEKQHLIERITDTSPNILYIYSLQQHRNVYANREISRMLGYTPEEVRKMGNQFLPSVIHPEDYPRCEAGMMQLSQASDNEQVEVEYRIRHANGNWHWFYDRVTVFSRDDEGKVSEVLGSSQDITEWKKTETELRTKNTIIDTILHQFPTAMCRVDQHGIILENVGNGLIDLGIADNQLIGTNFMEVFPEFSAEIRRALQGEHVSFISSLHHEGKPVYFQNYYFYDAQISGATGFAINISEQKIAEMQLRDSQRFIQQIAETSPDLLYVDDIKNNENIYINRNIFEAIGYSPEEASQLGRDFLFSLIHPEDREQFISRYARYQHVRDGEIVETSYRLRHKTGDWHWLLTRNVVFKRNTEGIPEQVLGVAQDITEKKLAEEEIRSKDKTISGILAHLPVVISRISQEGKIIEAMGAGSPGLRWSKNITGASVSDIFPQADSYIRQALQGEAVSFVGTLSLGSTSKHFLNNYFYDADEQSIIGFSIDITEQKEAEAKLIESEAKLRKLNEELEHRVLERTRELAISEERYRSLVMATSSIVWTANGDGSMSEENISWQEFTGQSREQLLGFGWMDAVHPEDRERNQDRWQRNIEAKVATDSEYRLMRHDGQYRYMSVRAVPILDNQENIREWVGTCSDIHDHKLAEEALRKSEEQVRLITDALPVLISYIDADEIYRFNNRAYEEWFKLSRQDIQGKHLREVLGEPAYQVIKKRVKMALLGNEVSFEAWIPYQRRGRRYITANYIPHRENGKTNGFYVLITDITGQKQAQEELYLSNERFRLVTRATNEAIWDWDMRNQTVWWNDGFTTLFGYLRMDIEPGLESRYSAIHTDDQERVISGIRKAVKSGAEQWSDEYRFRRKNGSYAYVLDRGYILRNESGKPVRMLGSMLDLTDLKKAQLELENQAEALRRSNAELEQYTYIASHDLQEPLNTMSSFAKLLERRYKDKLDTDAGEFIDFIVDASSRMKLLINNLLQYSRIGRKEMPMVPTNLAKTLEKVIHSLRSSINETQANLTYDTLPVVPADELQMVQLFQHLLANALKFHDTKSLLLHVSVREQVSHWQFSVSDTGIGLDMAFSERIFQPFQRLHTRNVYPGTGIGLAICKKIVERHGGKIWVESTPGTGSTFHFTLRKQAPDGQ